MFWIFYFFCSLSCEILVSQSGIEPTPPALEDEVLTAGPPGKSPYIVFLILFSVNQEARSSVKKSEDSEDMKYSKKVLSMNG